MIFRDLPTLTFCEYNEFKKPTMENSQAPVWIAELSWKGTKKTWFHFKRKLWGAVIASFCCDHLWQKRKEGWVSLAPIISSYTILCMLFKSIYVVERKRGLYILASCYSFTFSYQGKLLGENVLLGVTVGRFSHTIRSWVTSRTVPKGWLLCVKNETGKGNVVS